MRVAEHINEKLSRRGYHVMSGKTKGVNPPHCHQGWEILLVHSGIIEFTLGTGRLRLSPGTALMVDASLPHQSRSLYGPYVRTVLHFDPDLLPPQQKLTFQRLLDMEEPARPSRMSPDGFNRAFWAARQLQEYGESGSLSKRTAESLTCLMLSECESAKSEATNGPAIIWDAIEYMRTHTNHRHTISDIAKMAFVSESHFRQLFREHVGVSPHRMWLQFRIEKACELLTSRMALSEIASLVGFESLRGFQKAFQKATGMSPSEFRDGLETRGLNTSPAPR